MKALHVIPVRITDVKHFIKHYNLDERQRRGLYGFLASQVGYGGATAVARDLEVSPITVNLDISSGLGAPISEAELRIDLI